MTRTELLKKFDALVGAGVAALLPLPEKNWDSTSFQTALVIRPGGLGDALLLAPAITVLARHYPALKITVLAEKRNAAAFSLLPEVSELLLYDTFAGFSEVVSRKFDLVIDTEQWHRLSAAVARLAGRGEIIGFATNERSRLFTSTLHYSQDAYEAESFLQLLSPLGINEKFNFENPFLQLPAGASTELEVKGYQFAPPYVSLFPGASIEERKWGGERFKALVERLEAEGIKSVIVGGRDDKCLADEIAAGTGAVSVAGVLSLAGTAAVINDSALLVSGDSGILHLGVGLGRPTVSLFGSGIAVKWAPRGAVHRVINKGFSCSPCTLFGTTPPCPHGVRCLSEISVDEVFEAVQAALTENAQGQF